MRAGAARIEPTLGLRGSSIESVTGREYRAKCARRLELGLRALPQWHGQIRGRQIHPEVR